MLAMFCRLWNRKVTSGLTAGNWLTQQIRTNQAKANCKRRGYTARLYSAARLKGMYFPVTASEDVLGPILLIGKAKRPT